jgi:hypothetical protein
VKNFGCSIRNKKFEFVKVDHAAYCKLCSTERYPRKIQGNHLDSILNKKYLKKKMIEPLHGTLLEPREVVAKKYEYYCRPVW